MKNFVMNSRIVKQSLSVLVLGGLLIGCGGTKTVITADDSAEYKDAISLPPLKKPSSSSVISSQKNQTKEPAELSNPQQLAESESLSQVVESPSLNGETPASEELSSSAAESQVIASIPQTRSLSSSQVIELEDDIARLQIDAKLDSAWEYVSDNLKRSDITVHTRNKTAGRFAIGCASMQDGQDLPRKRGGWSFLSKKAKSSEHCSLMLVSGRSGTQAKLLDRSGVEYAATQSKALFARLLNN